MSTEDTEVARRGMEGGEDWEGRTADLSGRKVRAVGVGWASSVFFGFAQNDEFVGGGRKGEARARAKTEEAEVAEESGQRQEDQGKVRGSHSTS